MEHYTDELIDGHIASVFDEALKMLEIEIDEKARIKLLSYFSLLLKKNKIVNLISPKQDIRTQLITHLVDSLTPLLWPSLPQTIIQALDFGSGGGLPAIPLAIVRPAWRYTLIEATGKKAQFLDEASKALCLDTVNVINSFLAINKNPENRFYDLISARAVSDFPKLFSIAGPRLKKGGFFIAFKGPRADQELKDSAAQLKKQALTLYERLSFRLPFIEAERRLFIFRKQ